MPGTMEFGLLGPLAVHRDGKVVPVRRGHPRALLAVLLLKANQAVPVETITEALWGPAPPRSALVAVRSYIQWLRQAFGGDGRERIVTQPRGYLIRVARGELDVARCEHSLASARASARGGSWQAAAGQAQEALSWWRGQPLADVESDMLLQREVPRLAELRLQAAEIGIDAGLQLGGHAEAAAEAQRLCAAHPLREHLHALLMLALYRCGRQAEALAAYQHARSVLLSELGAEPGTELQTLHRQILRGDAALRGPHPRSASGLGVEPAVQVRRPHQQVLTADPALPAPRKPHGAGPAPAPGHDGPATARVVPRQLPAAPAGFAGREPELRSLTALLEAGAGGGPVAVTISGTPGVGKTALALQWAHQVAARFPDGQLYVNLGGFGTSPAPVTPAEAIAGFLESLGVPAGQVPSRPDARAALYRSLLAGQRMLVILDNAREEAQVRPLLPGSSACLVLVTSRNELTGLAATQGARPVALDVLTEPEARQLLAGRLGAARVTAEAGAASELIGLCGHLPLALAIAAARAAARPALPLASLTGELRDIGHRLDGLNAGDEAADIKAVFSWSCRQLGEPAARMFRLLGVHPGPDIAAGAAASLAAVPAAAARSALAELVRVGLVHEPVPGRFTLHDLLRAYAAGLCEEADSAPERRAALHRVLDHYLHTGNAAAALTPAVFTLPLPAPGAPAPGVTPEDIIDPAHATAWFEAEHQVLTAAAARAAGGFDAHAMRLPLMLHPYLCRRGRWHDSAATGLLALAAARRLGDLAGQGHAHCRLGTTYTSLGSPAEAEAHLRQALALYQRINHHRGQGVAHTGLEVLRCQQQRDTDALYHAEQALKQYRIAGYRRGEAGGLNNLGWWHVTQGDPGKAVPFLERAIDLETEAGPSLNLACAKDSLGYARYLLGEHQQAIASLQEAETLARELGDRPLHAAVLEHLGDACHSAASPRAARRAWQKALDIHAGLDHHDTATLRAKLANSTQAPSRDHR